MCILAYKMTYYLLKKMRIKVRSRHVKSVPNSLLTLCYLAEGYDHTLINTARWHQSQHITKNCIYGPILVSFKRFIGKRVKKIVVLNL